MGQKNSPLSSIEEGIESIRQGKILIVVDDEKRENEGDLIMAAEFITPEAVNFMVTYGRGLICVSTTLERLTSLKIDPMVQTNTSLMQTPFYTSVDYVVNTTTGISTADRAKTIRSFVDPETSPQDLAKPGHIFPLCAKEDGVLRRAGHTEAVVDFCCLAGLSPAGVLCEILNEDGTMARLPDLKDFAKKHDLKICSIADLISYRLSKESLVQKEVSTNLPTEHGNFDLIVYESKSDFKGHVALTYGDISKVDEKDPLLVRVHSECLTGDVFHSNRCDCGKQLNTAMEMIAKKGRGIILYMRQEGRGIGFLNKMRAYALQDSGLDTVEANQKLGFPPDMRNYGIGAQILKDLGALHINILTNNPKKMVGLKGYGITIHKRIPLLVSSTKENQNYLKTKKEKLGHLLELDE
ncbi:bifunctional 3,4-dihydroxy-2-butanone 4-phosphate synthase/GTP cyclohydrolase II [PVC group bacterium (ex Bugula neritina AB1)]|nr:bifunctional 3,4-dihydroxy-2-butanone 4-phosphate synthase/GTP cyclohydrolase II [PVC group bacterium (ex Bugula neritina AB1)]